VPAAKVPEKPMTDDGREAKLEHRLADRIDRARTERVGAVRSPDLARIDLARDERPPSAPTTVISVAQAARLFRANEDPPYRGSCR
jgi:hypothetical protein